jgi:hypothetical protein
MLAPINFTRAKSEKALDDWLRECRAALTKKYPKINFDSGHWPIRTLYQTEQSDWNFTAPLADFADKDPSFQKVMRCLLAEKILDGSPKDLAYFCTGFRLLKMADAKSISELTVSHCRKVEAYVLSEVQHGLKGANVRRKKLVLLQSNLDQIASKGVIAPLGYVVSNDILKKLTVISERKKSESKAAKARLIDRKIEALNDAIVALLDNDPRLDGGDRVAICLLIILMCAPSRINEVLCMAIDDHVTIDDYVSKEFGTVNRVHSAHQMLLMTMKGSKGASWSAKPALLFMMDLFHFAMKTIQNHGERSRMLVQWYLMNPTKLYLPPTLEYLRGKELTRRDLDAVLNLRAGNPNLTTGGAADFVFKNLAADVTKVLNPNPKTSRGGKPTRKFIDHLPWSAIEPLLLQNVHNALAICRKVTRENYFQGDLAKMLWLFDRETVPYLPSAFNYHKLKTTIRSSFKRKYSKKNGVGPSLFEKLGITMPIGGKVQAAAIDSHDPRRWLTTMALRHGEKLSDALVNLWANRFSLEQLKAYDLRLPEEMATMSQMPQSTELADLSAGLEQANKLEDEFGLKTSIVTVHTAGISVTSMDLVMQATENRPVAKTSNGIFIIYPSRFGVCVHPHYATPCTNYSSCIPCDQNGVIKGHLPTNEALRKRDKELFTSIVRQLETLATTHNRKIADDQDALAAHMIALVRQGLNQDAMQAFAKHLIEDFHDLKHRISDKLLASRLEEAFVTTGYVERLDDPSVASGAFIKYHNPTVHASPKLEMAIDEQEGGREQIKRKNEVFIQKYPVFALSVLPTEEQKRLVNEAGARSDHSDEEDGK